ncbi:MAG TPA: methyltransferase domain-containing protein [Candidatus Sulfotelmatobacter sp.]|jgi:ubiquinone/menaquinone biosynthesis C-methylase UbiE
MRRVNRAEILDSGACSAAEVQATLAVIGRINRRFGGVSTSQKLVEETARSEGLTRLSLLEVAAGSGDVPEIVRHNLAQSGITLDVALLDVARSHLPRGNRSVVADGLQLPFSDGSFDLVSCNLFAHHLTAEQLRLFVDEGLRVCRRAVLINDLVRNPVHLALVYASFPIMRSRVAWLDGLTSVRRAYTPSEIRKVLATHLSSGAVRMNIFRHYLFRMGIAISKSAEAR